MNTDQKPIVGAILIAGAMIAGAILLKDSSPVPTTPNLPQTVAPKAIIPEDRVLGNPEAQVTVIMYEDFQCPFCGAVSGLASDSEAIEYLKNIDPTWEPFMPTLLQYAKDGTLQFVYRDFPFLGPESFQAAEAARCAGAQGTFWEYHDYLYAHQNGENKGAFSDENLKTFAKTLGLDASAFDTCLDGNTYEQAVLDSKTEGAGAGVTGTPKGFILKRGKVIDTIDGAESLSTVKPKLDAALR